MPKLSDDTIIHEWCFEFWSPQEEDWVDYGYWTLSDNEQVALQFLMNDEEGKVEHLTSSLNTWTYKQFKTNQGECLSLIRDFNDEEKSDESKSQKENDNNNSAT